MTQDQYLKAKEMYINKNISLRKISNELNINRKLLSKKLKEDNILIRDKNKNSISKAKRFNSFDNNIFKKIDNEEKAYRIAIYSKELAMDLIKLGCFQNKSLILKFPTEQQVPKHLIHHFMRGYFDGDGCVTSGQGQLRFSVIGTKLFLEKYEDHLLKQLNRTKSNK